VVAAEVRNLAQRSAGAAKEIKALISDSVDNQARNLAQAIGVFKLDSTHSTLTKPAKANLRIVRTASPVSINHAPTRRLK